MFKSENCRGSDVGDEIETELLPCDVFNLDEVNNLFFNQPEHFIHNEIIEAFDDSREPLPQFPVSPIGPPDRYPMSDRSQFVVQISSTDVKRKKYLYSHKLNRIYVDIDTCFSIEFNWNQALFPAPMYVRSTVVFSDKAQAQKRVEVCVSHFHTGTTAGKTDVVAKNVLLSTRIGTDGVYYCGLPDRQDSWLSLLVEFNKQTDAPCIHAYQFVCKNSCSTGINRRAIEIIFTLEDKSGTVYGRQCVGARVCACPNRDLHKDEREAPDAARGKKRRCEPGPAREHMPLLPALPVVNKHVLETGLTVMLRMMEQALVDRTDPQAQEDCHRCIAAFKKYLGELNKPS